MIEFAILVPSKDETKIVKIIVNVIENLQVR